ncbi:hypothetical protein CRG98_029051 [Punica granatum]|nr:hypothetical protein CRG98_029051 [Punica granatum]
MVSCQTVSPECPSMCGNVSIRYPFGVGDGCFLSSEFSITCNTTHFDPPRPFLSTSTVTEVKNISLDGELWVDMPFGSYCPENATSNSTELNVTLSAFSFSSTRNKFTAIGCSTLALITNQNENINNNGTISSSGCFSTCNSIDSVIEGSCDGIGCCQTVIPKKLSSYIIAVTDVNSTAVESFSKCSYAFIVEEKSLNFSKADLANMQNRTAVPAVVDWAIWNETCDAAKRNPSSYACKAANSTCYDPENISGYRCNCSDGFQGNPYLPDGCEDIDECKVPENNPCSKDCRNILGSYRCSCPVGFHGDGRRDGEGCSMKQSFLISIIVGVGVGFVVMLFTSGFLYFGGKKRKLMRLKEKYFELNGGLLLQQQLHQRDGSTNTMRIFTAEELEKATDSYAENRIVGQGGYGTVYKGTLPDNTVIAIKKSKVMDQNQIEQFINEVIVLSQINHRNVVKLLGCCLETEVPLLVYKFISNGTLFHHIHDKGNDTKMPWETRLRIAAETAGVLSYLHSAASVPIIHRDIKSTNILLDEDCVAKVSDFGASRLVPLDQAEMSTMVQGTLGYLDPEYLHTSTLTEKSDVYSFGVVLVELMTGRKALSFDKPEEERCLAMYFVSSLKEDRLLQIIEESIARNDGDEEQVKEVAVLAKRCLRIKGEDRPTMKEVAMELEGIRVMANHPWVAIELDTQETQNLLGEATDSVAYSNITATYDSMTTHVMPPLAGGR